MRATYNLLLEYDVVRYNERLHTYEGITEEEAQYVIENGYIIPTSSAYYKIKNIMIVTYKDGNFTTYKATRKGA